VSTQYRCAAGRSQTWHARAKVAQSGSKWLKRRLAILGRPATSYPMWLNVAQRCATHATCQGGRGPSLGHCPLSTVYCPLLPRLLPLHLYKGIAPRKCARENFRPDPGNPQPHAPQRLTATRNFSNRRPFFSALPALRVPAFLAPWTGSWSRLSRGLGTCRESNDLGVVRFGHRGPRGAYLLRCAGREARPIPWCHVERNGRFRGHVVPGKEDSTPVQVWNPSPLPLRHERAGDPVSRTDHDQTT